MNDPLLLPAPWAPTGARTREVWWLSGCVLTVFDLRRLVDQVMERPVPPGQHGQLTLTVGLPTQQITVDTVDRLLEAPLPARCSDLILSWVLTDEAQQTPLGCVLLTCSSCGMGLVVSGLERTWVRATMDRLTGVLLEQRRWYGRWAHAAVLAQWLATGALLTVLIVAGRGVVSTPLLSLLLLLGCGTLVLLLRTVARHTTGAVLQVEPIPWSHRVAVAVDVWVRLAVVLVGLVVLADLLRGV
jgi:hypothetical protein